jgi:hypothetical protein
LGNEEALRFTGADPDEIGGKLLGDVFECANATLPGGCGRTVHCSGCAIRKAVEQTWETGTPQVRVPATLQARDATALPVVALEISTEKVGEQVLLRIDWADPGLR